MNGTILIDGFWDFDLVDEPIILHVEDGFVFVVKGGTIDAHILHVLGEQAKRLRLKEQDNVRTYAEFGFGMNPKARLMGNVLEDEKRLGTVYISIGDNTRLGGTAAVGIHISGVVKLPNLWLDETPVIEDGKFLVGVDQ